jgi:hypothetical protein
VRRRPRAWGAGTGRERRRASSIFPLNCRRGSKRGAGGDSLAGPGWGARLVVGLGVSGQGEAHLVAGTGWHGEGNPLPLAGPAYASMDSLPRAVRRRP